MIKNRFSKTKNGKKINKQNENNIWSMIKRITNRYMKNPNNTEYISPSYQQPYNYRDIGITNQYLLELENNDNINRINNINIIEYHFDSSQNNNMIDLDNYVSDGDIEEEPDDLFQELEELELKYDLNDIDIDDNKRRFSQEVNHYHINQLNPRQQETTIIEEEDKSDSSVITTIISGDSKHGSEEPSNSSQTSIAMSVNSLSVQQSSNIKLSFVFDLFSFSTV